MSKLPLATFGAGCFYSVEKCFRTKFPKAISKVKVGYSGGDTTSPSYQLVCSGMTGHAQVIQFSYDPAQVSYAALVDFFFRMHDPTTTNRQGADIGTHYRSLIFYHDDNQKAVAEEAMKSAKKAHNKALATTLEKFSKFYEAESSHQDYLTKNPKGYQCSTHFERSWDKIAKTSGGVAPITVSSNGEGTGKKSSEYDSGIAFDSGASRRSYY